jgi:hypothetical protein
VGSGSAWVEAAWVGAVGAMGETERIRAGTMGDVGVGG